MARSDFGTTFRSAPTMPRRSDPDRRAERGTRRGPRQMTPRPEARGGVGSIATVSTYRLPFSIRWSAAQLNRGSSDELSNAVGVECLGGPTLRPDHGLRLAKSTVTHVATHDIF